MSGENKEPKKMGYDISTGIIILEFLAPLLYLLYFGYLTLYNGCSTFDKFNPNVIARVNETILRDPMLANVLRNNTYTITITDAESYPYIDFDKGAIKCHPSEVTAEIRLNKSVSMTTQYDETQIIKVKINFDRNTVDLYYNEPAGFTRP
ncbi:MAG: hypothetical protein JHC26_02170 [Thermofilum sp.]|jgi:hypothetical protein|uniref:hypothetical protein n=1 Tax=Thermofilum sp. TaxID=1961369 RepID=UPI00258FFB59|nr:hypothetical protein [Thermofilum sp.]MCI4407870.1 hypothetical protein [Thermofilum sp.]